MSAAVLMEMTDLVICAQKFDSKSGVVPSTGITSVEREPIDHINVSELAKPHRFYLL